MANHPHNSRRPESASVKLGVEIYREEGDIEPLRNALSPRQRAYCEEYVVDYNGWKAAKRAGYAGTEKTLQRQSTQLKRNMGVNAYIDFLTTSKEAKIVAVDPDYVIAGLTKILQKPEARDGDKIRVYEILARHLGMFIDRTEITGKDGDAIRVEQQRIEEEAQSFTHLLNGLRKKADEDKKVVPIR